MERWLKLVQEQTSRRKAKTCRRHSFMSLRIDPQYSVDYQTELIKKDPNALEPKAGSQHYIHLNRGGHQRPTALPPAGRSWHRGFQFR